VERAVRALIAFVLLTLGVSTAATASAQTASVTVQLVRQSPWSSSYDNPHLLIWVSATNSGSTSYRDLSVALTIGEHYDSRVSYESSLDEGPTVGIFQTQRSVRGTLDPFEPRTFKLKLDLSTTPGIDQVDSLVYPARVDILSGQDVVASLTTPILYFVRPPLAAMRFTWWIELEPTIAFGPDGRLADTAFADSLSPDGQLGAPIAALDRASAAHPAETIPTSLVITPSLVEQAQRMVHGYTRVDGTPIAEGEDGAVNAAGFLDGLRTAMNIAGVDTVTTPFSGPTVPSMLASDLKLDLDAQQAKGIQIVQALSGVPVRTPVARPIAGALSDEALDWLASTGGTTVLGDTTTVDRAPEAAVEGGEPAPTATLTTPSGSQLDLVLPDPGAQSLLERPDLLADPVRAAQAVLGELAVEWKEAPVPAEPNVRGRALALPSSLPPGLWAPLLERFRRTPFLAPQDPVAFAGSIVPRGASASLRAPDDSAFPLSYTEGPNGIRGLQGQIVDYESMLTEHTDVPDELRRDLYYAESAPYVVDPAAGEPWLSTVRAATRAALDSVRPQVGQGFTFTSGEGTIPVVMGDPGAIPLRVTIRLESSQFEYPDGNQQDVTLTHPNQVVSFRVVAKAAGQNPIVVRVLAPNGHGIGEPQAIVVRSTAFNRIALIVTLAAASVLALLYSRRWFRRTKVPS
jgi:hypothetical protein